MGQAAFREEGQLQTPPALTQKGWLPSIFEQRELAKALRSQPRLGRPGRQCLWVMLADCRHR
jgi:hypothetical protein